MARELVSGLRAQLLIIGVLVFLFTLSSAGLIPPTSGMTETARSLVEEAYWGLLLVSFVESLAGLNAYFPGSIAILAGMGATKGDPRLAVAAFLAIVFGAAAAQALNFRLGRSLRSESLPEEHVAPRTRVFWLSCWHPHFGALAAIAAGRSRTPFLNFLRTYGPAFLAWNSFWGVLMYSLGLPDLGSDSGILVLGAVLVWAAMDARRIVQRRIRTTG